MEDLIILLVGIGIGVFCCENKDAREGITAIWTRISETVRGWFKNGGLG
jgi:hypothetical protein